MRIAVISDIHGDLDALRHVLAEVDRIDVGQIWCLGDIVGLGATAPAEVVDLVRDRCALALAGNHDRWVTGQLSLSMLPLSRQRAQLQWQHRVLSNEQLTWLAALPAHGRAHDIELWHGSAQDPVTGWISSPQDAADHLARQRCPVGLVGHTHQPLVATMDGSTIRYDEHPMTLDVAGDCRAVLNPGAVLRSRMWLDLDLATRYATWHQGGGVINDSA
jgi:predicted phosphodiesterase